MTKGTRRVVTVILLTFMVMLTMNTTCIADCDSDVSNISFVTGLFFYTNTNATVNQTEKNRRFDRWTRNQGYSYDSDLFKLGNVNMAYSIFNKSYTAITDVIIVREKQESEAPITINGIDYEPATGVADDNTVPIDEVSWSWIKPYNLNTGADKEKNPTYLYYTYDLRAGSPIHEVRIVAYKPYVGKCL